MEIRKEDEEAAELMKNTLADNGHSYAFIDANSLPLKSVNEDHLKDHFRAFKPSQVSTLSHGANISPNCASGAMQLSRLVHPLL